MSLMLLYIVDMLTVIPFNSIYTSFKPNFEEAVEKRSEKCVTGEGGGCNKKVAFTIYQTRTTTFSAQQSHLQYTSNFLIIRKEKHELWDAYYCVLIYFPPCFYSSLSPKSLSFFF